MGLGLLCCSGSLAVSGCILVVLIYVFCFVLVKVDGSVVVEWSLMSGLVDLGFPVVVDSYSLMFSVVVMLISSLVMVFLVFYMVKEAYLSRFTWLVVFFVFSMNLLVFVPNLVGVILGWDGLGLISFLLVIYYQNKKSLGAGMVTALMNRVGDALLLLGVSVMSVWGHWGFWGWEDSGIGLWLFLAVVILATTKSAQFPFSYWLPAAMSAPTPVSALVHSSTLVTAGVFVLIRVVPNISVGCSVGGGWLLLVSVFTLCMAGVSACVELDLKKVVALSTLSQLGVMMFSLSLGYCSLAFFHLLSHALFKSMLFVSVGCVIHGFGDGQDFRVVGGLWLKMPVVAGCLMLASVALSGLPFLGGFYSKDLIVEGMMVSGVSVFLILVVGAGLAMTFFYSMRFFLKSVFGNCWGSNQLGDGLSFWGVFPMVSLGLFSIGGGYFLQNSLFSSNEVFLLEVGYKSLMNCLLGFGVVVVLVRFCLAFLSFKKESHYSRCLVSFFSTMWFGVHSVSLLSYVFLVSSGSTLKIVDVGWNESVFGGVGVFGGVVVVSKWVRSVWGGVLSWGVLTSFGVLVLMALFYF